jgi:CRP-like cAMP-binding protein
MSKERVFTTLSTEEEEAILQQCRRIAIRKDETLLRKGEETNALYIVKSGELRVMDELPGEKVYLSSIGRNELFGEMSFLDESPRSASVQATRDTELYRLTKEEFVRMLLEQPKLSARLVLAIGIMLVKRLRRADRALTSLAASPRGGLSGSDLEKLLEAVRGQEAPSIESR